MDLVIIVHNIRSTHNVGSILRSAEGFGVRQVYFTGYSPYPEVANDNRLPHIRNKITQQIHKTALGAESMVKITPHSDISILLDELKTNGFQLVALEQSDNSVALNSFKPGARCAVLLGEEVNGVTKDLLKKCDAALEIPMRGKKESFNVSVAAGIALYQLTLNR